MKRRASTSRASSTSSASLPESPVTDNVSDVDIEDEDVFEPAPELVSAYETIMRERVPEVAEIEPVALPSVEPTASTPQAPTEEEEARNAAEENARAEAALGRSMTKAEKQNAKKKRRKERERAMKAAMEAAAKPVNEPPPVKSAVVDFPVFSAPAPVNLDDTEYYPVTTNPRLVPLPAEVRERIARLASEAVIAHETHPILPPPASDSETIYTRAKVLPPSFVAHFPQSKLHKGHGWAHINVFVPDEPEPEEPELSKAKRRRLRRQVAAWRDVPVGDLYRAGKANGYGWGF